MKSPLLIDSRLADIIAAIQVMGTYRWTSMKSEKWGEPLGKALSASEWSTIFKEHPEVFRFTNEGWASLRWRHGYLRTFDSGRGRELSEVERAALTPEQNKDLTHRPLSADQIESLMKTVLEFHARAIAHEQERRWLAPLLFALLGAVLSFAGAVLGAWIK